MVLRGRDLRSYPISGVGALIGPTIGSAIWRIRHRPRLAVIDEMDREFFKRIAKNRVDASLQSPTNPVPDYYGVYSFLVT
jgi:mitochondrial import inner membrane translocase subunit TIM23